MPLLASGSVSAAAVIAAGNVVKAEWLARGLARDEAFTAAEIEQMRQEIIAAEHNAFFAHIAANMGLTFLVGAVGLQTTTALAAPTGPPAAPVPLLPGVGFSIT